MYPRAGLRNAGGAEISAKTISRLIQFRESVTNESRFVPVPLSLSLSLYVRFTLSLPLPTCVRHSWVIAPE